MRNKTYMRHVLIQVTLILLIVGVPSLCASIGDMMAIERGSHCQLDALSEATAKVLCISSEASTALIVGLIDVVPILCRLNC